jgi:hypothetical protein
VELAGGMTAPAPGASHTDGSAREAPPREAPAAPPPEVSHVA